CGNAWANRNTISIEHANDGRDPWTVGPQALDAGAHLTAAICLRYGLGRPEWMGNVFPHSHWSSTQCPGELAGGQRDEYMRRARAWYDHMTEGAEAPGEDGEVTDDDIRRIAAAVNSYSYGEGGTLYNQTRWPDVPAAKEAAGEAKAAREAVERLSLGGVDVPALAKAVAAELGDSIAEAVADKLAARMRD
ncbi:N-acetylmuramoyl-L-alanine amidase, partial [Eggerthellaceae bacterium zg-997]|nr:N-acetylmuramoyl-L-alanine amidase [Eggerthellaceae bacterium zg-997]